MPLPDEIRALSARSTAQAVQGGLLDPQAVAAAFAARVRETEPSVQAWEFFDPGYASGQAARVDKAGPLAGVTLGVKDVIDTADMPTGYGSAAYAGTRPPWDAPCVEIARRQGAVMMGKTVSTEFAMSSPGKTLNPHAPGHTPGGSSSGSCAAVAAGMAHAAFGTQTSGSLVRPGSFCGVVAYKPSFGTLNRAGVKVLADSLDTLGLVTRDVRDAAFLAAALAENPALDVSQSASAPRFGLFRTSHWHLAGEATRTALERAADALRAAGALVEERPVPDWFETLFAFHDAVMGWETPRSLAYEHRRLHDRISPVTLAFLDTLARATRKEYAAAMAACTANRRLWLEELLGGCDALITPAAPGEAPRGLDFTGDPVFNKAWTLLHGPCLSVPAGKGPGGLPVGVQVVGRFGEDARTLAAAAFLEDALTAAAAGRA